MNAKETVSRMSGYAELIRIVGHEHQVIGRSNKIVRTGMGVLARALAGSRYINGMYLAYTNGVVATSPVGYDYTTGWFQTIWNSSERGFVRVPLAAQPSYGTSDSTLYTENQARFTSISTNAPAIAVSGNEIQDNITKYCMGGLCWLDTSGYGNDILFAAVAFEEPTGTDNFSLTKLPNAQIGMRWTITFETDEA